MLQRVLLGLVLCGLLVTSGVVAQPVEDDCTPDAVAEWMVQRQVGRNRIQPMLESSVFPSLLDAILLTQEVRRDLEALPRPACADELYMLTIYFYNGLTDAMALQLGSQFEQAVELAEERSARYSELVDPLYEELQTIAGIDIMAAATAIQLTPTTAPTLPPAAPIQLSGATGGIVVGPIDIPPGVYRARLTSGRPTSVILQLVSGNCSTIYLYTNEASTSNEGVLRSDGCRALFEVGASPAPWMLDMTPIQ